MSKSSRRGAGPWPDSAKMAERLLPAEAELCVQLIAPVGDDLRGCIKPNAQSSREGQ
jgi:hypothetical protein